jgi:ABC-type molybdate transport system substrate-binding protein
MHATIEQQAILLQRGTDRIAAKSFLEFLRGEAGRAIIRRHGYGLPEVKD